ncbi:hypothetical protein [Halomicrococcus gelatinilyticus]|uniref:hypothetical protein n=1 Tax=Halomicrococcus gelatinilyticus TaxID=1702103 RepID=UPI002E0DD36B
MSSDEAWALGLDLPDSVEEWLDERAEDAGTTREAVVRELLAAHRSIDGEEADPVEADRPAAAVEDLREEFTEKLEDVRERVIQVKREADEKAPAGHDHADLREDLAELDAAVEEMEELREQVEANRRHVDSGFENYEEVLSYLTETTDELEEKLDVLAAAMVDVRDRTRQLAAAAEERAAVADLARTANRNGVKSAVCESCDLSVTISLLREPECPHCGAAVRDIDPKQGFFGSNTLVVGDPPALEGETLDDVDFDELFDEVSEE